jgi:acetyl esterase/lipase
MMLRFFVLLALSTSVSAACGAEPQIVRLWPGQPPGDIGLSLPPEGDTTKPDGRLVAGRRVMRIGNVSTPTLAVYPAPSEQNTGTSIIICPGGGHHILAYDLEGTEVAEWLNGIGVTAFVLKYRVPARERDQRWRAAVQDAQRAVSLVRGRAAEWSIDPQRIGILGFSAGGETAALTALFTERQYEKVDDADDASARPDFAVLVYAAGVVDKEDETRLRDHIRVSSETPPMFFAHAYDDRVSPLHSVLLFVELKKAGIPAELHVYAEGGHGYGLRETDLPVTTWHHRCAAWMATNGWLQATAP